MMYLKFKIFCLTLGLFLITEIVAQQTKTNVTSRIVGGTSTTIAKHRYLVNLRRNGVFFCGGSLIRPRFVLTAAHCVKGVAMSSLTVVGGSTRLSSGGVSRKVSKVMIPAAFNINTMHMDVAVLKLTTAMTGTNISPIGLCNKFWNVGNMVQVSGWGLTRENGNTVPDVLQTVKVPIINRNSCAKKYRYIATLTRTMFCASVPGQKDSCNGDSGGPVVYNNRVCGIVSWGVGCARRNYPGVYTNVRKVRTFIDSSLKK